MTTARVFKSGNSQAVRLPKDFRFASEEVEIFRRGDEIILRERRLTPADGFRLLASLPDDFMAGGREDQPAQEREQL
jgi:antitoxin VapB